MQFLVIFFLAVVSSTETKDEKTKDTCGTDPKKFDCSATKAKCFVKKDAAENGGLTDVECSQAETKCTQEAETDVQADQETKCKAHGSGCTQQASTNTGKFKCVFNPVGHCACSGAEKLAASLVAVIVAVGALF